jgi:rRNA-processing protein FCF1
MKALLDTNFLMVPAEFRVDVISELTSLGYIEFFTLDLVVSELERLSTKGGRLAKYSRVALEIVRNCSVTVLKTKGDLKRVDDEIYRLAREKGYTICSQDKELIRKAKSAGLRCITLRQNKYLVESGEF